MPVDYEGVYHFNLVAESLMSSPASISEVEPSSYEETVLLVSPVDGLEPTPESAAPCTSSRQSPPAVNAKLEFKTDPDPECVAYVPWRRTRACYDLASPVKEEARTSIPTSSSASASASTNASAMTVATTRSKRTSAASKPLTLADFAAHESEVLAPRDVGPTWCPVTAHVEGKLVIELPEGGKESLSLIDLQRWMRRSSPSLGYTDVVRPTRAAISAAKGTPLPRPSATALAASRRTAAAAVAAAVISTAAAKAAGAGAEVKVYKEAAAEPVVAHSTDTSVERQMARALRAKHSEAATCPWVGSKTRASTRRPLQTRTRSEVQQMEGSAAEATAQSTYAAIERKRGIISQRRPGTAESARENQCA